MLAGGRSSRLGGTHKPALPVADRSLLEHVLLAFTGVPTVVVGRAEGIPDHLRAVTTVVRESPPGGGPVAAVAEGIRHIAADTVLVAIAAGDMPFLTQKHFLRLINELHDHDVVVPVARAREQWLASVWSITPLRRALDALGDPSNQSVHKLAAALDVRLLEISDDDGVHQLFDIDTPDDLHTARRMSDDG